MTKWFGWVFIFLVALYCWGKSFSPKMFLQSTALPFYSLAATVRQKLDNLRFKACSQTELINLCTQLWNENTELRRQHEADQQQLKRIQALEHLMNFGTALKLQKCYARVIKREISAWWDQLVIDKGQADGIRAMDLVVAATAQGLSVIGKVASLQEHYATVILTTSPKFHLAVTVRGFSENTPMIFYGGHTQSSSLEARGLIKNIPMSLKALHPGTPIVPVTLQQEVSAVALGTILSLEPQGDGFFLQATASLPAMGNICEVAVIHTHE